MEEAKNGYPVQQYTGPVKRYCQTLDLRDNPELIAEYRRRHSKEHIWKEVMEGIRQVGILVRRVDSLEKTLMLGGIGGRRRRGRQRMR